MTTITGRKTDFSTESLAILEEQFETLEIVLPPSTPPQQQPTLEYESFEDNERWVQMKNNASLFQCPSDDEDEEGTVVKQEQDKHHHHVFGRSSAKSSSREVAKLGPFSLVARWETALENLLDKFGCGGSSGDAGGGNDLSSKFFYAAPNSNDGDDMMDLIGLQFLPEDDANE